MRWLLERGGPIDRFNQAMLLQVPAGLQEDHLIAALQAVLDHHDALRLRLIAPARTASGAWRLRRLARSTAETAFAAIDVCGLDDEARRACIAQQAQAAADAACSGSRSDGAGGWFDAGAEQAGRLLLTIHHLAVDGVSWRILVPDLAAAWEAIARGAGRRAGAARAPRFVVGRNGLRPRRRIRSGSASLRSGPGC